jgi:hypothetical protein
LHASKPSDIARIQIIRYCTHPNHQILQSNPKSFVLSPRYLVCF